MRLPPTRRDERKVGYWLAIGAVFAVFRGVYWLVTGE